MKIDHQSFRAVPNARVLAILDFDKDGNVILSTCIRFDTIAPENVAKAEMLVSELMWGQRNDPV